MRLTALVVAAAAFTLASATAWACPMQTVAKSQAVASSDGSAPSTPIPPRGKNG